MNQLVSPICPYNARPYETLVGAAQKAEMPLPVSKHTPAGSFDLKLSVQWKALNITENSCKAQRKEVKKYLANERIHGI